MATNRKIQKEGIVLRQTITKEADAMVDCLGPEGVFAFYARGIGKLTSKNGASCSALSHSIFTLIVSSNGSLSLSEAKPLESFLPSSSDLSQFAVLSFLQELSAKLLQDGEGEEIYPWLLQTLKKIKEGFDPLTAGLIYFAHLLVDFGIGLDVDECIVCHKKSSIAAISYEDGGFLCKDHFQEGNGQLAGAQKLKIIRYLFRVPLEMIDKIAFEKEDALPFYKELGQYLHDQTGASLKSISLFEKL